MLDLQHVGCHNINFVTPEHVVSQILEALIIAVERGLRLPVVYNTSAYEGLESIGWMDGIVDIYMPDSNLGPRALPKISRGQQLRRRCVRGDRRHARTSRRTKVDENGLALRGVLVRHLVMASLLDDAREIMRWIGDNLWRDTYVNLVNQYYPAHKAETEPRFAEINRGISADEFCSANELARATGLWRLDSRWRYEIPHDAPVWLPQMRTIQHPSVLRH